MRSISRFATSLLRPPSVTGRDWQDHAHLYLLRLACVLCGLLIPAFGVLYQASGSGMVDSIWIRLSAAGAALLLLGLTYLSAWIREHASQLLLYCSYALTVGFAVLSYLNGFTADYAVGYFFVWVAAMMFTSLAFEGTGPMTAYIGISLGATILVMIFRPEAGVDTAIYVACMLSAAVMVYVAVSARMQVQSALEEREAHLNEAQETAGLGNWEVEVATGTTYWSDEMYRIAGLDPYADDPSFEALAARVPFDQRPALFSFWDTLRNGEVAKDLTLCLFSDGPTDRIVRLRGSYDPGGATRPERLHGICLDVTAEAERAQVLLDAKEQAERAREESEAARIQAEAAREQAEHARLQAEEMARLKSAFLANMSHEIRTPLTAIIGFAQVLSEEVSDDQRDLVEPIEQSGKRLLSTLNSVLDLARLKADGIHLDLQPLDIAEEVHTLGTILRPMAEEKGLTLKVAAPPEGIRAIADASALHRVLTNLLSNAIKFTSRGQILVGVDAQGEQVRIRVRDSGRGIGPEFLPKLFEEFRQESTGVDRTHEGSGLGLAITKGLVDLMGGAISVDSVLGQGTLFTVLLPQAERSPYDEEPPARSAPHAAAAA